MCFGSCLCLLPAFPSSVRRSDLTRRASLPHTVSRPETPEEHWLRVFYSACLSCCKYRLPLKAFRACRAKRVRATLCAHVTRGSVRAGAGLAPCPALGSGPPSSICNCCSRFVLPLVGAGGALPSHAGGVVNIRVGEVDEQA